VSATVAATGEVTAFDERRGVGEVTVGDATVYPFHCTAIAGGTRTVEVGARVEFDVVPGLLGRWEAAAIKPARAAPRAAPAPPATRAR
jgi:cold shock protein